MLATTRKVDSLGRIVIPKEMRDELGAKTNDKLLVQMEHGKIIIELQAKERSTYDIIYDNLKRHYPDMGDTQIRSLVMEYINYDR